MFFFQSRLKIWRTPKNMMPEGFFAQKYDAKSAKYDTNEQQYDAKMVFPIFA